MLDAERLANIGFEPGLIPSFRAMDFDFPGALFGDALVNITEDSNTGMPGVYAYRVDMLNIMQPNG